MDYSIIIRPLIGAGIGYVTNWIAVKMMFRPLKPITIGKYTLPFTPGIIPKNKARLAEAIGNSISTNLLTEDTLKKTLLSKEMKENLKLKISNILSHAETETSINLKDYIESYIGSVNYNKNFEKLANHIAFSIYETIISYDLGNLITQKLEVAAKEKIKGSALSIFGGKALISSISEDASYKINEYIETEGENLIHEMVTKELNKYASYTTSDIYNSIESSNISIQNLVINIYEDFIIKTMPSILNSINISNIVKNKINSMEVLELENLILQIMKKELNALINLGALIGFILGLVNLLF